MSLKDRITLIATMISSIATFITQTILPALGL